MDRGVYGKSAFQNIELVEKAIEDLRKAGAIIVEPGPEGLLTPYIRRYNPMLSNSSWTKLFPELFPVDEKGKPANDHVLTLVDLAMEPSKVPGKVTLRDFGSASAVGEGNYGSDIYLRQRGDANIKTLDDLVNKANFYDSPNFPTKKTGLASANKAMALDTAVRLQRRFAIQQIVLACMAELKLDALIAPTGLAPARKLLSPNEPSANGIGNYGMFTFLGAQGFPVITVPAGFTTEMYEWALDPSAPPTPAPAPGRAEESGEGSSRAAPMILTGPTPAKLPVGVDFIGRPFSEPTLLKIAAAYEKVSHHRTMPPDFGLLPASE
jgi:Asp-tRNA(Asn)/Glu-tRNA(Gln) amidotransferase A subunit family amidase